MFDGEQNPDIDPSVSCTNCKAVCCRLEVIIISDTGVPEEFIQKPEKWGGMETMKKGEDGWCIALDRKKMCCSIYDKRPQICRDFDMGSRECKQEMKDFKKL